MEPSSENITERAALGTSHLIWGDSQVKVLQNLRKSFIAAVMAFIDATMAQLQRMFELMNPRKDRSSDDSSGNQQSVQGFRSRRRSTGRNVGLPIHCGRQNFQY